MATQEGVSAWEEAVTVLSAASSLPELQWSEGLAQACYDHISDQGPTGGSGHTGTDGSTPFERIDRYVTSTASGENLAYSDTVTGTDMILQLYIDDGVPNRGHRVNIVSTDFTHAGVSCGCHTFYTEMCCIAYARDPELIDSSLVASTAPQLQTCEAYDTDTVGDKSDSFDIGSADSVEAPQSSQAEPAEVEETAEPEEDFEDSGDDNDWGFDAGDMFGDWDDQDWGDQDWGDQDWDDQDWGDQDFDDIFGDWDDEDW
jgi:hypothetical protein